MYSFPKNNTQIRKWLHNLKLKLNAKQLKQFKVCSEHFEGYCKETERRLRNGSLPTLNLGHEDENIFVNKSELMCKLRCESNEQENKCVVPNCLSYKVCDIEPCELPQLEGEKIKWLNYFKLPATTTEKGQLCALHFLKTCQYFYPTNSNSLPEQLQPHYHKLINSARLMPYRCCVPHCSTDYNYNFEKLKSFPSCEITCSKWCYNIKIDWNKEWHYLYRICTVHFESYAFRKRGLASWAMPNLQLGHEDVEIYMNPEENNPQAKLECCVPQCSSHNVIETSTSCSIKFFKFPLESQMRQKWMHNLSLPPNSEAFAICSLHFEIYTMFKAGNRLKLRSWALPTLKLQRNTEELFLNSAQEVQRHQCLIASCGQFEDPEAGIVLYDFPKSESLSQKWAANLRMPLEQCRNRSICMLHFEEQVRGKYLYKKAVPTLALNHQQQVEHLNPRLKRLMSTSLKCALQHCNGNSLKKLHKTPWRNVELMQKWRLKLGWHKLDKLQIRKLQLCSQHFEAHCFDSKGHLKEMAVPSLNLTPEVSINKKQLKQRKLEKKAKLQSIKQQIFNEIKQNEEQLQKEAVLENPLNNGEAEDDVSDDEVHSTNHPWEHFKEIKNQCCISNCDMSSNNLYAFPKIEWLLQKWCDNTQIPLEDAVHAKVCHQHFEPEVMGKSKPNAWAIPTLLLNIPNDEIHQNPKQLTHYHDEEKQSGKIQFVRCNCCAIVSCLKSKKDGVQLYKYPKGVLLRKWAENCKHYAYQAAKYAFRICSNHFEPECIGEDQRLRKGAVPTLNLGHEETNIHVSEFEDLTAEIKLEKSFSGCCVEQCTNFSQENSNVRFYKFPQTQADILQSWCHNLKVSQEQAKSLRVCSLHFEERCFNVERLRRRALPTIQLGHLDADIIQNPESFEKPEVIVHCCVASCCKNKLEHNVYLSAFPKLRSLFEKWAHNLQLPCNNEVWHNYKVCSEHFEKDCYDKGRLKFGSIPTLQLGHEETNIYHSINPKKSKDKSLGVNQKCCYSHCQEVSKCRAQQFYELPQQENLKQLWLQSRSMNESTENSNKLCALHYKRVFEINKQHLIELQCDPEICKQLQENYDKCCESDQVLSYSCCIKNCESTLATANIRLHSFPTNIEMLQKWCHNTNLQVDVNRANVHRVCSLHFEECCIPSKGRVRLWALPTLNLGYADDEIEIIPNPEDKIAALKLEEQLVRPLKLEKDNEIDLNLKRERRSHMKLEYGEKKCKTKREKTKTPTSKNLKLDLNSCSSDEEVLSSKLQGLVKSRGTKANHCKADYDDGHSSSSDEELLSVICKRLKTENGETAKESKVQTDSMPFFSISSVCHINEEEACWLEQEVENESISYHEDEEESRSMSAYQAEIDNDSCSLSYRAESGSLSLQAEAKNDFHSLSYQDSLSQNEQTAKGKPQNDSCYMNVCIKEEPLMEAYEEDASLQATSELSWQQIEPNVENNNNHTIICPTINQDYDDSIVIKEEPLDAEPYTLETDNNNIPNGAIKQEEDDYSHHAFEISEISSMSQLYDSSSWQQQPDDSCNDEFENHQQQQFEDFCAQEDSYLQLCETELKESEFESSQMQDEESSNSFIKQLKESSYYSNLLCQKSIPNMMKRNTSLSCRMPTCNSHAHQQNITLHKFPVDEHQFRKWTHNTQLKVDPSTRWKYRICNLHFESQFFRGKRLVPGTVPTLKLGERRPHKIYTNDLGELKEVDYEQDSSEKHCKTEIKPIHNRNVDKMLNIPSQPSLEIVKAESITSKLSFEVDNNYQNFEASLVQIPDPNTAHLFQKGVNAHSALKCSIISCKRSLGDDGVHLHRLPENPMLRRKWIFNLKWNPQASYNSYTTRVCSIHFENQCFYSAKRQIKVGSIPTLLLGHNDRKMYTSCFQDVPIKSARSSCAVPHCPSNVHNEQLELFDFPFNHMMMRKWCHNTKVPPANAAFIKICGLHFETYCFEESAGADGFQRKLKSWAVPTMLLGHSEFVLYCNPQEETDEQNKFQKAADLKSAKESNSLSELQQMEESKTSVKYNMLTSGPIEQFQKSEAKYNMLTSGTIEHYRSPISRRHLAERELRHVSRQCRVEGCTSRMGQEGLVLHRFPQQDEQFRKWVHNTQLPAQKEYFWRFRICSRHFEKKCYLNNRFVAGIVPTLQLGPRRPEKIFVNEFPSDFPENNMEDLKRARLHNRLVYKSLQNPAAVAVSNAATAVSNTAQRFVTMPRTVSQFQANQSVMPARPSQPQQQQHKSNCNLNIIKVSSQNPPPLVPLTGSYAAATPAPSNSFAGGNPALSALIDSLRCSIGNCGLRQSQQNVYLHKLPDNMLLRGKWLYNCRLNCSSPETLAKIRICSKHFYKNCFEYQNVAQLKLGSIPMLHLGHSESNIYYSSHSNAAEKQVLCSMPHCRSRRSPENKMFRLPLDEQMRHAWQHNLKMVFDMRNQNITFICSKHFEPSLIGVKRLIRGAIPTLLLGHNDSNIYQNTKFPEKMAALGDNFGKTVATTEDFSSGVLKCNVPSCSGNNFSSQLFSSFPSDFELFSKWCFNLKLNPKNFVEGKFHICKQHFEPFCIGGHNLRAWAVPTLSLGHSGPVHAVQRPADLSSMCCLPHCRLKSNQDGVVLFKFPRGESYKLWCELLQLDLANSRDNEICSLHFTSNSYSGNILKPGMIPTINLGAKADMALCEKKLRDRGIEVKTTKIFSTNNNNKDVPTASKCAVPSCNTMDTNTQHIVFYRFPENSNLCVQWCHNIKLDYVDKMHLQATYVLCGKHFENECLIGKGQLHAMAVPTLALGHDDDNIFPNTLEDEESDNYHQMDYDKDEFSNEDDQLFELEQAEDETELII